MNVEGVQQVSVDSNTDDLLASLTDSKRLISSGFPESSPDAHTRHFSEDLSSLTINDLRVNRDEVCHSQFEGKGIGSHGHARNFSEDISSLTINELRAAKLEENCHNQLEGKVISRHNSAERNIFKAAEIAERFIQALDNRVLVETAAPIESVKDAVSKFGGILDWKERRKNVQVTLDKVREDVPEYQRRLEFAEVDKSKVMRELCSTRRVIEGLKLSLEKVQTEALQAQQDSEIAEIRYKEIQQGIARRESAAVKAEIDLAKERHASALADLQSVKEELEQLQKEHTSLITQRENTEAKAHESTVVSQEIEKTVEDLTLELISLKESLTSSHATHIIAEERRINVDLAYQQEKANWQNELKQADEEVQKLNDEISANKDLESKLEAASVLLENLQGEFTNYVEGILPEMASVTGEEEQPMVSVRMTLAKTRKELEDMRTNIEKAKDEVKGLWNTAAALRADLEKEKAELTALKEKEHRASVSASSIQEELSKLTRELILVQERIKAARMPPELQQATQETERAKAKARLACDEVAKATEEAARAKAEVNVVQLRLEAVSREILAVNASEEIAMASANALQEYKQEAEIDPRADRTSNNNVMVSLEEYDALSRRAQEAEDLAKKRVIKAVEKIKEAKEGEVRSLDKLSQLSKQIDDRRVALRAAQEKAIAAQDGKLTMENEMRKRRAQHEQQHKTCGVDLAIADICTVKSACSFDAAGSSASNPHMHGGCLPRAETIGTTAIAESKPRKSYFPRSIVTMFMTRKKHLK